MFLLNVKKEWLAGSVVRLIWVSWSLNASVFIFLEELLDVS